MFQKIIRLFACVACLLISLLRAETPSLFIPTPFVNSVNVVTGQIEAPPPANLLCDYYAVGNNQLGEVIVKLAKGDFRIGRVKTQYFPASKERIDFFYAPGLTEIHDHPQRKMIYRYAKWGQIEAVEHHQRQPDGTYTLYRKEQLFWTPTPSHPLLTSRVLEDGKGQALLGYHFVYNERGQLIQETLFGNLSGRCSAPLKMQTDGTPQSNGIESYSKRYTYSDAEPSLLTSEIEDSGMMTTYHYHPQTKQCLAKLKGSRQRLLMRTFYDYDNQGLLKETIVDDGQGQQVDDFSGITYRQIAKIRSCQEGSAFGQPLQTEKRYLDLTSGQDVLLEKVTYTYSEQGALVQQDFYDANEALRYYVHMNYDDQGQLLSTVDSRGEVATLPEETVQQLPANSPFIQQVASADAYGNETDYVYDAFGRLIEVTLPPVLNEHDKPIRFTLTQEYNVCDQLVKVQDAKGRITQTTYNSRGKPVEITYPDGSRDVLTYFLDGELKEKIAANGVHFLWERDDCGRIVHAQELSSSGHLLRELFYTYRGSLISSLTDRRTFTTHMKYDDAGRLICSLHETKEGVKRLEWTYDACGQKIQTREWFGPGESDFVSKVEEKDGWQQSVATHLEDSQGIIQQRNKPTATAQSFLFTQELMTCNALGQYVKAEETVDARGIKELKVYDALQRLESCIKLNAMGEKIGERQIRYDGDGQKILERHSVLLNGKELRTYTIQWSYDTLNRVIAIHEAVGSPKQKTTRYHYNDLGQLAALTKPDGVTLTYAYDERNLLTSFTASDQSFAYTYAYDDQQRLVGIHDRIHSLHHTRRYSDFNELIEETLGSADNRISNLYDRSGRRTCLTLPDNSQIFYHYEGAHLKSIERVKQKDSYRHGYARDLFGNISTSQLIKELGELSYRYDKEGSVRSLHSAWWSESVTAEDDSRGRVSMLAVQDPKDSFSTTYTYADDGQLIQEEGPLQKHYHYDSLYNRLAEDGQAWTINALNQLEATPRYSFDYDANGNLIEKRGAGENIFYKYDALNRLIRVSKDKEIAVDYIYDTFDRRIQQRLFYWSPQQATWTLARTEQFLYDGQKEIGKMDGDSRIVELRVLGLGKGAEISAAISLELYGKIYAPIHDHQGSVRCLIDSETCQVAEFYRYSAFGMEEVFDAEGRPLERSLAGNPWRFSSKRLDEQTGLVLFGKRYYDPQMGRWISPDPLFFYDTPNLYAFVKNDSINCYDLYGLFSISEIWNTSVSYFFDCFRYLQTSAHDFKTKLNSELKLPELIGAAFERAGKKVFGELNYLLMGHSYEKTEVDCYGQREMSDKVRVTFINGILTTREGMQENLELISQTHGGTKVHYIFRPTEGWTWDITRAILIKTGFHVGGFRSLHAHLLAAQWRSLIREMGGTAGGGTIIHYAHSLGGTETDRARELLNPEEQRMIRVVTFGSATLVRNEGFQKVTNIVCIQDGVSVFLEPFGHIRNFFDPHSNVQFYGSLTSSPYLPIDHLLCGTTYNPIMKQMGEQFLKEFSSP